MNILFVVNNFPPGGPQGGIVSYVETAAKAWKAAGHQVSVICQTTTGQREDSDQEGIRVVRVLPKKYPGAFKDKLAFKLASDNSGRVIFHKEFSFAAFEEMQSWQNKPDIIEVGEAFGWAWAFLKQKDIPVVLWVHGPNYLASKCDPNNADIKSKALDDLEIDCMRHATAVFVSTEFMKGFAKEFGVDVQAVVPYPITFRNIPEVSPQTKQMMTLGRLIPGKGMDMAIRMLTELPEEWTLVIAGPDGKAGPNKASTQKLLEELSEELGVSSRVRFTGALPDKKDILELLASSFVLIHDSKNDNMPYVILESLSVGTQVVASAVGGIPETLITHWGVCVPQGDIKSYVEAVLRLKGFKNAMQEEFYARHGSDVVQKQVEEEYKKILGHKE